MAVFGGSVVVIAAVSSQFLSVHYKSECYAKSELWPSSCVGLKSGTYVFRVPLSKKCYVSKNENTLFHVFILYCVVLRASNPLSAQMMKCCFQEMLIHLWLVCKDGKSVDRLWNHLYRHSQSSRYIFSIFYAVLDITGSGVIFIIKYFCKALKQASGLTKLVLILYFYSDFDF